MNKQLFLREDWATYKSKFKYLCPLNKFTLIKYSEIEQKEHTKQIKIEKI